MPAIALTARLRRWYWNQTAAWCVLFRRRDVAIEFYQRMLAQDPRDALALASIGYQYAQLGRKSDALATFDRLVAMLCGTLSIRDVIAFPKTAKGTDLMTQSPAVVDPKQLRDVYL